MQKKHRSADGPENAQICAEKHVVYAGRTASLCKTSSDREKRKCNNVATSLTDRYNRDERAEQLITVRLFAKLFFNIIPSMTKRRLDIEADLVK